MLYYFRSNVILLLKGTQGTSLEKSRNFFGEVKKLPKRNQGNSQTKPRNFKKEVQSIQERNPINLQSNHLLGQIELSNLANRIEQNSCHN